MTLKEMLIKLMNQYAIELAEAKASEDFKRPFGSFVRQDIAGYIRSKVDDNQYKVKGSVGAGRWTDVPWIAVFDKRITTSAQRGVYIVYLLNKDSKELFLTLNQGATNVAQGDNDYGDEKLKFTGIATASNDKTTNSLKSKAAYIREQIGNDDNLAYGQIDTGSKAYDAGCIYYKKYSVDSIPDDDILCSDLALFIKAYQKYYDVVFSGESEEWWPSLEEYPSVFSKEQWLDILNNPNIIGPVWGNALAMFYTEPDGATCSQIAKKFNDEASSISGRVTNLAKRIHSETGCHTFSKGAEKSVKYWPILFQGRKAKSGEIGTFVWRLRSELYEALEEFDILRYLQKEATMDIKENITSIKKYIEWKGFSYSDKLIENFYLSLKSKPFVILAGTSGTGKTRLVKLFAEAIGAEYKMVPVRPDWSDSSDLFGHLNLNGEFIPGVILEFVSNAHNNPERPYILCLDEMNLARVEYYLSDFLSVIETRELRDGVIVSDPLVSSEKYGSDKTAYEKYGELGFPQNLYIVGTVNMDETTFPFSKKVLDRANTIEFSYVDLVPKESEVELVEKHELNNDFLVSKYLFLLQSQDVIVGDICGRLQAINEVLRTANAHVGYRVRDEIVFYMLNNKTAGLLSENDALDFEIMQKILPRIQGSSLSVKNMLCELFKIFAGDYDGYQTQSDDTASRMIKKLQDGNAVYPRSAEKVAFMVRRFEEDGFTSYWL